MSEQSCRQEGMLCCPVGPAYHVQEHLPGTGHSAQRCSTPSFQFCFHNMLTLDPLSKAEACEVMLAGDGLQQLNLHSSEIFFQRISYLSADRASQCRRELL